MLEFIVSVRSVAEETRDME